MKRGKKATTTKTKHKSQARLDHLCVRFSPCIAISVSPLQPSQRSPTAETEITAAQGAKKTTTMATTAVADPAEAVVAERPPPLAVEYDPITGIPSEYNDYLPSNCEEYKR